MYVCMHACMYVCNHQKPQRTHSGIFSVLNRPYFKLFLITYQVNGSSRNFTPRNTTRDAFMNKYIRVRELIFRLSRDVSLGRLWSNSLNASATTASKNLTSAPRGCKIVCKRVLFFDNGQAGYFTYLGSPPPC